MVSDRSFAVQDAIANDSLGHWYQGSDKNTIILNALATTVELFASLFGVGDGVKLACAASNAQTGQHDGDGNKVFHGVLHFWFIEIDLLDGLPEPTDDREGLLEYQDIVT